MSVSTVPESVNIQINCNYIGGIAYPSDSELKVEYVNGKKEGEGAVFSSKRTKLAKLHYHEDKLNGFCVFYDSHGIKVKEAMFENDIHNGWGCEYQNDKVVFEGMYQNGQRFSELRQYRIDNHFMEEVKDGKTVSICKLTEDHKRDGMCYFFENGVLKSLVEFENGIEKRKIQEFRDKEMIEFDDFQHVVYKGEYRGNIPNGFERTGKGEEYKYKNHTLYDICYVNNNVVTRRWLCEGERMKEYENGELVYEGEFLLNERVCKRHGVGIVYSSETNIRVSLFENGIEKKKIQVIVDDEMVEYDESGNLIVYIGGYRREGDEFVKSDEGLIFDYENGKVKEVYDSEEGERCIKRLEFDYDGVVMKDPHDSKNGEKTLNKSESSEFNIMIELNEDGRRMYRGGYSGCPRDGYVRNGEGDEYDENDLLVYSGGWKKGMREGNGILYDHSDVKYNGCWKDNKPNGKGKLYDKNGNVVHEGIWKNGYFMVSNNTGIDYESLEKKELYENGNVKYEGEWNGNVYEGWGVEYDKEGNIEYEGNWIKGIPNGYGKCYHKGKVYKGKWKNGVVLSVCHLCWFSYNNKKKTNVIKWWCATILDWLCQCGECIWDGFVSCLEFLWNCCVFLWDGFVSCLEFLWSCCVFLWDGLCNCC